MKKVILFIISLFILADYQFPQDKNLVDQFRENFKKKYFNVGILFKSRADFQAERTLDGNSGFRISNFRWRVSGEVDYGFSYYLQTEFTRSPALLDAFITYNFLDNFYFDLGQYKAPFSTEQLFSESALPFVARSQAVDLLPPKRQIGLQLRTTLSGKMLEAYAGIFNGNGTEPGNDNQNFMYVGRIIFSPLIAEKINFSAAANAAFSNDNTEDFTGDRILLGGDVRITIDQFSFSSEFNLQRLEGADETEAEYYGYHITGAYNIIKEIQVLARWDYYKPDESAGPENKLVLIGSNFFPSEVIKFQFNYIINTDDSEIKHNQVLLLAQLSL